MVYYKGVLSEQRQQRDVDEGVSAVEREDGLVLGVPRGGVAPRGLHARHRRPRAWLLRRLRKYTCY